VPLRRARVTKDVAARSGAIRLWDEWRLSYF